MARFVVVTLLLLPFVGLAPEAGAACDPTQPVHVHVVGVGAGIKIDRGYTGAGVTFVADTCEAADGDGDPDLGAGGAALPLAGAVCLAPGTLGHHGLPFVHADNFALPMAWSAGTDGAADPWFDPCLGNGVVSDDPASDPHDCGAGQAGFWDGVVQLRPAEVAPNGPWADCAQPVDGRVWAFAFQGPILVMDGPLLDLRSVPPQANAPARVTASVPTTGTFFA